MDQSYLDLVDSQQAPTWEVLYLQVLGPQERKVPSHGPDGPSPCPPGLVERGTQGGHLSSHARGRDSYFCPTRSTMPLGMSGPGSILSPSFCWGPSSSSTWCWVS